MPLEMGQKNTECEWVRDQLSAYSDGQLTPEERERVEAHLSGCQACSAELADLRLTIELLHEVPMVAVPRSFTITTTVTASKPGFSRAFFYLRNATAAAAALLIVLVVGAYLLPQTAPSGTAYAPLNSTKNVGISSEKPQSNTAPLALSKSAESEAGNQNDATMPKPGQNPQNQAPAAAATAPARAAIPAAAPTSSLASSSAYSGASSGSGVSVQSSTPNQSEQDVLATPATAAVASSSQYPGQSSVQSSSQSSGPSSPEVAQPSKDSSQPGTVDGAPAVTSGTADTGAGEVGTVGGSPDAQSDAAQSPSPEQVFAHDARDNDIGSNRLIEIVMLVMIWLVLSLGTITTTIWLRERRR